VSIDVIQFRGAMVFKTQLFQFRTLASALLWGSLLKLIAEIPKIAGLSESL
jgi:hypothetical protein